MAMTARCVFAAWMAAWATAVFLSSAIIAWLGLSPLAAGADFARLPASIWAVADEVGPAVKLMIGGLLLAGFLALGRLPSFTRPARLLASMAIGMAAMAITAAIMPSAYGRGFAAALTGARFEPTITLIYLLSGALAGLVFTWSLHRCQSRQPQ
jgi:hypothetical protein